MTLEEPDILSGESETRARTRLLQRVSRWMPALIAGVGAVMVAASIAALYLPPSLWVPPLLASIASLLVLVGVGFVAERNATE